MNLFIKCYKFLGGLWLYFRYGKMLDSNELLRGKRIAIVGPASSAFGTNRGYFIDGYDLVIRINKAPLQLKGGNFKRDIGSKIDVLFHSFFENEFSGGGPLDFDLYDQLDVKYVINPIPTIAGKRVTFNFYKKYLLKRTVYSVSASRYENAIKAFGKFKPTTGFCALRVALEADFSELFITGFTFFKTAYGDGYRDSLKDVDVNKKYIKDSNIHSPDLEYEQFKLLLLANKHKLILTDGELKMILAKDGININEAV